MWLCSHCDQIWRDFTTMHKFTSLWKIFDALFLIRQNAEPFWQNCVKIGLIFIVANGQLLKNYLTIWSHWCSLVKTTCKVVWRGGKQEGSTGRHLSIKHPTPLLAQNMYLTKMYSLLMYIKNFLFILHQESITFESEFPNLVWCLRPNRRFSNDGDDVSSSFPFSFSRFRREKRRDRKMRLTRRGGAWLTNFQRNGSRKTGQNRCLFKNGNVILLTRWNLLWPDFDPIYIQQLVTNMVFTT